MKRHWKGKLPYKSSFIETTPKPLKERVGEIIEAFEQDCIAESGNYIVSGMAKRLDADEATTALKQVEAETIKRLDPWLKHDPNQCPKKDKSYWKDCDPGATCRCGLDEVIK